MPKEIAGLLMYLWLMYLWPVDQRLQVSSAHLGSPCWSKKGQSALSLPGGEDEARASWNTASAARA